jgi:hypothetical protein
LTVLMPVLGVVLLCSSQGPRGPGLSPVSGGYGEGETPLPIPNRAVKPLSADGTWLARARESRSPPVLHQQTAPGEGPFVLATTPGSAASAASRRPARGHGVLSGDAASCTESRRRARGRAQRGRLGDVAAAQRATTNRPCAHRSAPLDRAQAHRRPRRHGARPIAPARSEPAAVRVVVAAQRGARRTVDPGPSIVARDWQLGRTRRLGEHVDDAGQPGAKIF